MKQYSKVVDKAIKYAKENASSKDEQVELASDALFVGFGTEILNIVPGRVSTEVDARYVISISVCARATL